MLQDNMRYCYIMLQNNMRYCYGMLQNNMIYCYGMVQNKMRYCYGMLQNTMRYCYGMLQDNMRYCYIMLQNDMRYCYGMLQNNMIHQQQLTLLQLFEAFDCTGESYLSLSIKKIKVIWLTSTIKVPDFCQEIVVIHIYQWLLINELINYSSVGRALVCQPNRPGSNPGMSPSQQKFGTTT